jgi:hypothetical protein
MLQSSVGEMTDSCSPQPAVASACCARPLGQPAGLHSTRQHIHSSVTSSIDCCLQRIGLLLQALYHTQQSCNSVGRYISPVSVCHFCGSSSFPQLQPAAHPPAASGPLSQKVWADPSGQALLKVCCCFPLEHKNRSLYMQQACCW